ncbi:hypothetical protein [Hydrogenophaga sp. T2]|uniref:hypothetical protein n=1 Tax=Hydrogenophaga sp. T2 TaxID=3132823 RepID=UPI003CF6EA57
MVLFAAAQNAMAQAHVEISRQSQEEEVAALDAVGRAIGTLRDAIERSPLPRGRATLTELSGGGLPPASLLIGWREVPDDSMPGTYATSVVDILALADELLKQHRAGQAVRAVTRHRGRPNEVAFVRWLSYIARHKNLRLKHGTLAAWCNVATESVLDAKDVEVILRNTPKPLKAPPAPR